MCIKQSSGIGLVNMSEQENKQYYTNIVVVLTKAS